jgi:hypothetical protein
MYNWVLCARSYPRNQMHVLWKQDNDVSYTMFLQNQWEKNGILLLKFWIIFLFSWNILFQNIEKDYPEQNVAQTTRSYIVHLLSCKCRNGTPIYCVSVKWFFEDSECVVQICVGWVYQWNLDMWTHIGLSIRNSPELVKWYDYHMMSDDIIISSHVSSLIPLFIPGT